MLLFRLEKPDILFMNEVESKDIFIELKMKYTGFPILQVPSRNFRHFIGILKHFRKALLLYRLRSLITKSYCKRILNIWLPYKLYRLLNVKDCYSETGK